MLSTKRFLVILLAVSYCLAEDKLPSDEVRPSQGNVKPNHKQSSGDDENAEDKFPSDEVRPRHGNLQINHKHSSDVGENGIELLHRQKRGWGSILFTGASMIIKATSLGLTLGSALSGGCMYFPSICTNKDEIERLDGKIKTMTRKYETDYKRSKMMYYTLKTATTDNAYIDYYINQTMQAFQKLQEIESDLTIFLQVKLPELSRMTKNETYEKYLEHAVGTLEYRLSDLKQILFEYKKMALIGIVVQFVVEATVNKFFNALKTAYVQVLSTADILSTTSEELWSRIEGSQTKSTKFGIVKRLKLAPKVLKQMAKNFGQNLRNFGKNFKKWKTLKSWKGFKGKLKNTFKSPIQKLQKAKQFFTPSKNKIFVKNYRLGWSQKIMMGISILGDAISTGVQVKQWYDVSKKMKKAREDYQQYHDKLLKELKTNAEETLKMEGLWTDVVQTFQHLSIPFKQLVENSTNFSNFSDVIGLPRLPVDTSGPLFSINFNSVTKESIRSQQHDVIQFLKKVNNNMTEIQEKLSARTIMYKYTLRETETEETVEDMESGIKSILQFNPSGIVREFGDALNRSDMVCTVSILRYDLEEYDYFPIAAFRPQCDVNSTIFEHWNQQAHKMKTASLAIKSDLGVCRRYGFCPCLSQVATTSQLAEKEVVSVLRHLDPLWQQNTAAKICIPSGCRCSHL